MRATRVWASVLALFAASVGLVSEAAPAGAACPLSISGISPAVGFLAGGNGVTIAGCGFNNSAISSITFGATPSTTFTVATDSSITVTVPAAGSPGPVTVTVQNATNMATTGYSYVAPPSITAIVPAKGAEAGGTGVTVTGSHLSPTAGATTSVKFGATAATTVSGITDTGLTAVSPAGTGTVNVTVTVTLPGGSAATSNGLSFRYVPAPIVASVSPGSGSPTGGTDVTVTGSNFQPGANVFFGPSDGGPTPPIGADTSGSPVSVLDSAHILVTTPAGIPGATNVVVLNPDGQTGALRSSDAGHYSFSGSLPTVSSVAPATGTSLGATPVTITGTGFIAGAAVAFKGSAETNPPTLTGATVSADGLHITGRTPAHPAGVVDVVVTNPGGGQVTFAGGYTYSAAAGPTVSTVSPTSSGANGSLGGAQVTVSGTNFVPGATVTFGTTPAASAAAINSTSIAARAPAHASGTVTITVTNPDGQSAAKASAFTYLAAPAPHITSVTPNTGAGGTQVTIAGTGFANTNGAAANAISTAIVSVGTAACLPGSIGSTATCLIPLPPVPPSPVSPPVVVSSTQIKGQVPNAPGGAATVKVTNPDGQVATSTFTYTGPTGAPTLSSITPSTGPTLGNTPVTLSGTNFVTGAVVSFTASSRSTPAATTVSGGGTTITTTTPAGVYGLVDVTVTNPGGASVRLHNGFTFVTSAAPTIASITPNTGPSGTAVTIVGTGFANTNGGSTNALSAANVTIGGRALLPPVSGPTVVSATAINGIIPTAAGGAADVAVTNPDGQGAILVNGYSYPTDTTAPTTTATALVGATGYTFGTWATGHVAVTLTADDHGGSGVRTISYSATGVQPIALTTVPVNASNSASFNITAEGVTIASFFSTDIAGNVESTQTKTVKVDTTAPAIATTASTPGGPYTSGTGTNADVMVSFSCTDKAGGSGVSTLTYTSSSGSVTSSSGTNPLNVKVSSTGADQSVTGTCTDVAGNSNSSTFGGINITRTSPGITASATVGGQPYTAGTWTTQTVTVVFTCVPISASNQVVSLTAPVQVNGPAHNQTVSGTCVDSAGNSSVATFGTAIAGIDIDLTRPVPTASATTTDNIGNVVPYLAGTWTNHDVVVTFACTDPGSVSSGVASISPPVTITAEGTTSGVTGSCTDVAGNVANPPAFFGPILIDKTAPGCTVFVGPNPIHPATLQLTAATATVRVSDALSGPNGFVLLSITSNHPTTAAADIAGFHPGTASTSGQLRAVFGRVYTFTYQGFDVAGNSSAVCTTQVRVTYVG